jgi:sugar/nucleoside kinase (ribokinase family)
VDLLAVGEAMVDVVAPTAEPGRNHAPIALRAGGSAINAAQAAAALGAKATVVARVGADPAGALLRATLLAAGVEPRFAIDGKLPTGCFVQVGERIVADRGANAAFDVADLGALEADVVLVSGYLLLIEETAAAATAALRAPAEWVGVDVASAGLAARDDARERLRPARVLFANADEAAALTGREPEAAARQLAATHEVVVVKLGAGGALATSGNGVVRSPAALSEPWLGDGDAFDAGVLVGLAHGFDLEAALRLGADAAASPRPQTA